MFVCLNRFEFDINPPCEILCKKTLAHSLISEQKVAKNVSLVSLFGFVRFTHFEFSI